jgi:hypothetical protein
MSVEKSSPGMGADVRALVRNPESVDLADMLSGAHVDKAFNHTLIPALAESAWILTRRAQGAVRGRRRPR